MATHRRDTPPIVIVHGTHCDCVQLAAALGLAPGAIPFFYCRNILQRRWTMTCRHGDVQEPQTPADASEKWKETADMNPVMAILVRNA